MSNSIAVIILTYNEDKHIERCIQSVKEIADEIFVVDSYSDDETVEIARNLGATVLQNTFINQGVQFNWALDNCSIKSDWIFRIDADEYFVENKAHPLKDYLASLPDEIHGLIIKRKIVFMGGELLYGGWYPKWNLRIFRSGKGRCEEKWMDEHIVVEEGKSREADIEIVDDNLNDLSWWTAKHNRYSSREVIEYFSTLKTFNTAGSVKARLFGNEAERKRWLKKKYLRIPLFLRPFLNFIYRYIFLRGFLDGKQGFLWHVLQGFWYRFLVDAKIYELNKRFNGDTDKIIEFVRQEYSMPQE